MGVSCRLQSRNRRRQTPFRSGADPADGLVSWQLTEVKTEHIERLVEVPELLLGQLLTRLVQVLRRIPDDLRLRVARAVSRRRWFVRFYFIPRFFAQITRSYGTVMVSI